MLGKVPAIIMTKAKEETVWKVIPEINAIVCLVLRRVGSQNVESRK